MSINSVVLVGNLSNDPELSYTANTNMAVCKFTLAVNRPRRNGEDQGADFIRIVVFGKQAEACERYLAKGSKAGIQGRIQTGSYKKQSGDTVYTTDIYADRVEFLDKPGAVTAQKQQPQQPQQQMQESFGPDNMPDSFQAAEDDIPF